MCTKTSASQRSFKKRLPFPKPSHAPGTSPATSFTVTGTGQRTLVAPFTVGPSTLIIAWCTFGSMVVNGVAPTFASSEPATALKNVDLPALGFPTSPMQYAQRPPLRINGATSVFPPSPLVPSTVDSVCSCSASARLIDREGWWHTSPPSVSGSGCSVSSPSSSSSPTPSAAGRQNAHAANEVQSKVPNAAIQSTVTNCRAHLTQQCIRVPR